MDRWQGIKHVVVVGLGMTGLSVVNYLRKYHADVSLRVIDTRVSPPGQTNCLTMSHCIVVVGR